MSSQSANEESFVLQGFKVFISVFRAGKFPFSMTTVAIRFHWPSEKNFSTAAPPPPPKKKNLSRPIKVLSDIIYTKNVMSQ